MSGPRKTGFHPRVRTLILERAGMDGNWCRDEVSGMWTPIHGAHLHHRIPRGAGSSRRPEVNSPSNALVLAPSTHESIESRRTAALEKGWLISKHGAIDPAGVEVELWFGRTFLTVDGTYRTERAA